MMLSFRLVPHVRRHILARLWRLDGAGNGFTRDDFNPEIRPGDEIIEDTLCPQYLQTDAAAVSKVTLLLVVDMILFRAPPCQPQMRLRKQPLIARCIVKLPPESSPNCDTPEPFNARSQLVWISTRRITTVLPSRKIGVDVDIYSHV